MTRRSCSTGPPTSFWLSLPALPKAKKGTGIWQSQGSLVFAYPSISSPCSGSQAGFFLPRSVNIPGLTIPSLLLMWNRLGNHVSFREMSGTAEREGQMRPRDRGRSLARLACQCCDCWAGCADAKGLPWGSMLLNPSRGRLSLRETLGETSPALHTDEDCQPR